MQENWVKINPDYLYRLDVFERYLGLEILQDMMDEIKYVRLENDTTWIRGQWFLDWLESHCQKPSKTTVKTESDHSPPSNHFAPFPCKGNPNSWTLTVLQYEKYLDAYQENGTIWVMEEIKKAWLWIDSKKANKKTARGMASFLTNWLARANDQGSGKRTGSTTSPDPDYTKS